MRCGFDASRNHHRRCCQFLILQSERTSRDGPESRALSTRHESLDSKLNVPNMAKGQSQCDLPIAAPAWNQDISPRLAGCLVRHVI